MELNIINLQDFNHTFNQYDFLNCNSDQKLKIIKNIINKANYQGNESYIDYLNKSLSLYLENYIIICFNDNKKIVSLLNKYLISLPMVNSYEEAIDNINKLQLFIDKYNYHLNKSVTKKLLTYSKKFSIIASLIVNNNDSGYLFNLIKDCYNELLTNRLHSNTDVDLQDSLNTYVQELKQIPLLTDSEEERLFNEYHMGSNDAFNKLVESNLRLVIFVSKRYLGHGLSLDDLIGEGNMGLVEAIKRFDESKNCKFSTYACFWIKRYIIRAIKKYGKGIRIPEHIFDGMVKYKKAREELENKIGREATIEEVAKYMDISVENAVVFDNAIDEPSSLNVIVNDDVEVSHLIASDDVSIEDMIMEDDMKLNVQRLLDNARLTDKEKDIISERYGFNGKNPKTLEEIGKKYGITRERVRQIEAKIFIKLRQVRDINSYMIYLHDDDKLLKKVK